MVSLCSEENHYGESQVEELHLGIGVLCDGSVDIIEECCYPPGITVVDIPCEVASKGQLVWGHRSKIIVVVVEEVLAGVLGEVFQEVPLLLSAYGGHFLRPALELLDLPLVGVTHEGDIHVVHRVALVTIAELLHHLRPTAMGMLSDDVCLVVRQTTTIRQGKSNVVGGDGRDVDALHTTTDGGEELFGRLAHKEEVGVFWWLLEELQQLVGTGSMHPLGEPDDAHLVASLMSLERQLIRYLVGFGGGQLRLLVVGLHQLQPVVVSEVGRLLQHMAPLAEEVVGGDLLVRRRVLRTDHREGEVEVGVLPLTKHRRDLGRAAIVVLTKERRR